MRFSIILGKVKLLGKATLRPFTNYNKPICIITPYQLYWYKLFWLVRGRCIQWTVSIRDWFC